MLLVTRVAGPETAHPNETIEFRAVAFNRASPSASELTRIQWLVECEGEELFRGEAGPVLSFDVPERLAGRSLLAMAFGRTPSRHVSATTLVRQSAEDTFASGLTRILSDLDALEASRQRRMPVHELLDRAVGIRGALDDLIDAVQPLVVGDESELELADDATRLAIVVGHTARRPGAQAVAPISVSEYAFNSKIAELMEDAARRAGVAARTFKRDGVGIEGAYAEAAAFRPAGIIELHFNAFSQPSARGTSTLCTRDNPGSPAFAQRVHAAMLEVFERAGRGDRGVKVLGPGDRGYVNVSAQSAFPSVLVEPFFGSSPDDCRLAHDRRQVYATALVAAFRDFADARGVAPPRHAAARNRASAVATALAAADARLGR